VLIVADVLRQALVAGLWLLTAVDLPVIYVFG
jgi:hypothetical protein